MKVAVMAYGAALALLLAYALRGSSNGALLMIVINVLLAGVAVAVIGALGVEARSWLPWRSMAVSLACLILVAGAAGSMPVFTRMALVTGLAAAVLAAATVLAATWWGSPDLRRALAR